MSSASEEHQHSHSHDHGHSHEHGHDHSHSHGPSSSSSTTASTSNESKGDASLNPPAAMINLGGPGWFGDVFEMDIKFNGARQVTSRSFMVQETLPLFRGDETITGIIRVVPPPNCNVSHYGITLKLESSFVFFESMQSTDISIENGTVQVVEPKAVDGLTEYPFEFNLASFKLPDTYDGEIMDIRHALIATIVRPWYTFNVVRSFPIAIHNVSPAPDDDNVDALPVFETAEHPNVPRGHVMKVVDCGGEITFDYHRSMFNIGDTLRGTISSKDVPQPLVSARIKLYKIEKGDGDVYEKIVASKDIITKAPEDAVDDAQKSANESSSKPSVRTTPLQKDETFDIDFVIEANSDSSISPTYIELNNPSDTVNIHYYLRLEFTNAEGISYWNTHEVILYRSQLSGLSAVEV